MTGYGHPLYADSLAGFGQILRLPRCGGSVLSRPIPDSIYRDAIGPYPLFACADWSKLGDDLQDIRHQLVSLVLVPDPFAEVSMEILARSFGRVILFKQHMVADLLLDPDTFISRHHRYYARRALKAVQVEICNDPATFETEWVALYQHLVLRHRLVGINAFSREALALQLRVPGTVAFRVTLDGRPVAGHIWYVSGNIAYSHLAASNEAGYACNALYAAYRTAIDYFAKSAALHWVDLGAGAGLTDTAGGLTAFKRGWATGTRPVYLCETIFQTSVYEQLSGLRRTQQSTYLPAYRAGESGSASLHSECAVEKEPGSPERLRQGSVSEAEKAPRLTDE